MYMMNIELKFRTRYKLRLHERKHLPKKIFQ